MAATSASIMLNADLLLAKYAAGRLTDWPFAAYRKDKTTYVERSLLT